MLGMTISRASWTFRVIVNNKVKVTVAILEKKIVIAPAPVGYDNISSKSDFQDPGLKVKVTVAIFIKMKHIVITLAPTFIDGFNITSKEGLWAQGQGYYDYFSKNFHRSSAYIY